MATLKDRTKSAVTAAANAAATKLKKKRASFQVAQAQAQAQPTLPDDPDVKVKAGEPITVTQEPPPAQRFAHLGTQEKRGGRRLIIACDGTWTVCSLPYPTDFLLTQP